MTIDEAIKERQKLIEVQEKLYEEASSDESKEIIKNATDNDRQLVEWLQELRAFRKIRMCGNCRHYVYGTTHFGECHVTSDIEPCVVGINQTACDTFFDYKDYRSCRQLAEWLTELKEAKRLLKMAVEDISTMPCNNDTHSPDSCYICDKHGNCSYTDSFKWCKADIALKLIGDESNK